MIGCPAVLRRQTEDSHLGEFSPKLPVEGVGTLGPDVFRPGQDRHDRPQAWSQDPPTSVGGRFPTESWARTWAPETLPVQCLIPESKLHVANPRSERSSQSKQLTKGLESRVQPGPDVPPRHRARASNIRFPRLQFGLLSLNAHPW